MPETFFYVCDHCGDFVTITGAPILEGDAWECASCGSSAAWEFTDPQAAREHSEHIRKGVTSGLFRTLA